MEKKSAYPSRTNERIKEGLTKQEYFAAKAMQGLLSNPEWMEVYDGQKYLMQSEVVANVATDMAKAVLKELEKTK